ncbi:hypothetical protein J7T55_009092 [Diaporthe amygdali]|uniref:uncharacterized protein n=1 Tax=Phomopsis amygdali TaxID=1214568 RepID=UPI0022FEC4E1|nr:uncharacterized protein J7T55_009092 [Diaporthe amygdali]KAJ0118309.1 hypothetical protein J7T55_009092 [Diaporthe amygdali]
MEVSTIPDLYPMPDLPVDDACGPSSNATLTGRSKHDLQPCRQSADDHASSGAQSFTPDEPLPDEPTVDRSGRSPQQTLPDAARKPPSVPVAVGTV